MEIFGDPIREYRESARRYLSHYIALIHHANQTIKPGVRYERQKTTTNISSEPDSENTVVLDMLEEELPNYLLAIEHAHQFKDRSNVCKLADELSTFMNLRSHWSEWLGIAVISAREAESVQDQKIDATAQNNLAVIYRQLERYEESADCSKKSLPLYQEIGDRYGEGLALGNLAGTHFALGELPASQMEYEEALEIFTELGDLYEQSQSLMGIGMVLARTRKLEEAISKFNACLTIQRQIGDEFGEAQTLNNLGIALRMQGKVDLAILNLQTSIRIKRKIGDRQGISTALNNLAIAYRKVGKLDLAIAAWEEALALSSELNLAEAERITERLVKVQKMKHLDTSTSK